MIERTEELGLAARLPIVVGGQLVELRTLNLEESEVWLGKLAEIAGNFDLPDKADPNAVLAAFAKQPPRAMLEMVQAYDLDEQLPRNLKQRFTQAELYNALKTMVRAEAPFLEDARSAAEAFGPQLRVMAASVLFNLYQQASSTNGLSPSGDSTPDPLEIVSPRNDSSSSGSTDSDEPAAKPTRKRSARRLP